MKNEKGITLIALVITIIVMLILVGVTVNVALNGGLFSAAKEAKAQTEMEKNKETLWSEVVSTMNTDGSIDFTNLNAKAQSLGFAVKSNGVYEKDGYTYTVDPKTGLITTKKISIGDPIPKVKYFVQQFEDYDLIFVVDTEKKVIQQYVGKDTFLEEDGFGEYSIDSINKTEKEITYLLEDEETQKIVPVGTELIKIDVRENPESEPDYAYLYEDSGYLYVFGFDEASGIGQLLMGPIPEDEELGKSYFEPHTELHTGNVYTYPELLSGLKYQVYLLDNFMIISVGSVGDWWVPCSEDNFELSDNGELLTINDIEGIDSFGFRRTNETFNYDPKLDETTGIFFNAVYYNSANDVYLSIQENYGIAIICDSGATVGEVNLVEDTECYTANSEAKTLVLHDGELGRHNFDDYEGTYTLVEPLD